MMVPEADRQTTVARAGATPTPSEHTPTSSEHFDVAVVGSSLAGCTAATLLARAGARVALVERSPDPDAFKRVCGHFIQSSAVPTLERLGLLEPIEQAGGVRSRLRLWTRWGYLEPPPARVVPAAVNIRRERLDPLVRRMAAAEPGVELMLGHGATALLSSGDRVDGVEVSDRHGRTHRLRARLVVGADGRDSKVAEMAGLPRRTTRHGRFAYAAYYEGPPPDCAPDGTLWLLDPQWVAAFPTDGGLTMYGCMPTKDRLPEFKRDLEGAMTSFIADVPDAPPILESKRVGPIIGKLDMPNVRRGPVAPGLALVGDAALATDPLWGVGCGWAFQSAEWLADCASAAVRGEEDVGNALTRYRRRFRRRLAAHALMIDDYAGGRSFPPAMRLLFSAAPHDDALNVRLNRFGTRNAGPQEILSPAAVGRAVAVHARRALRPAARSDTRPARTTVAT